MNWLVTLGFAGIIQGMYLVLSSWFLAFSVRTKMALTFLMVSHILMLLSAIFQEMDWYAVFPHFLYVRVPIPLLIGPSLFILYTGIFKRETLKLRKVFIHYFPFFFYIVVMLPYYVQPSSVKLYEESLYEFLWVDFLIIEHFKIVHLSIYVIWIFVTLLQEKTDYKLFQLLVPYKKLFIGTLTVYLAIICLSVVNFFLTKYGLNSLYQAEFSIALLTTFLSYAIAFVFIRYDTQWKKVIKKVNNKNFEDIEEIISALTLLMEEQKLYRNSELKINDVATLLEISSQQLSEIINQQLQTNFSQLLNSYRIEDFKQKVENPEENYKTLLGLAFESGFNSKSSFQRIFKEHTGMTPKSYKNSILNKSQ